MIRAPLTDATPRFGLTQVKSGTFPGNPASGRMSAKPGLRTTAERVGQDLAGAVAAAIVGNGWQGSWQDCRGVAGVGKSAGGGK